jgi:hypothetical protein
VSDQQPPWDAFRPQDQEPYQGQGQPQPAGQQPYGQQPFVQGQPPFGQQQYPYPQQPQGQYGPLPQLPYGPPGRRLAGRSWPRRHKVLTGLSGFIGLFVVLVVIGAVAEVGNHGSVAASAAASSSVAASAPAANPAAAQSSPAAGSAVARTVATFTGSGIQNTRRFTVTANWKLVYSFSCSAFGQAGNFAVLEDGGTDLSGVTVNDLALSKSASTWAYGDAGTHYLQIDSECAWKVKVVDES